MMQGGAHALASVVRVRLPSASSVPLKRAQSAAPSAHPALDSPLCARDATVQLDCSSSEQLFGNGLRRDLELSSAEVSTEPDPDGRLVRRPESRRSADLTTFWHIKRSDLHVPTAGAPWTTIHVRSTPVYSDPEAKPTAQSKTRDTSAMRSPQQDIAACSSNVALVDAIGA